MEKLLPWKKEGKIKKTQLKKIRWYEKTKRDEY